MRLLVRCFGWSTIYQVYLDGSDQLRRRPMGRVTNPLRLMGANIEEEDGRAPMHISPAIFAGYNTSS